MTYQIDYAYACHMGKVRANNEDNFWCCGHHLPAQNRGLETIKSGRASQGTLPVFAVFDGMGGESCGEMAAYLAAERFGEYYEKNKRALKKKPEDYLQGACLSMNDAVSDYGEENRISAMGTTMALAAFSQRAVWVCNLGDSRVYHFSEGKLKRVSVDHVLGGSLFGKAPLVQFLGIREENMLLEPSVTELPYSAGDSYLICSDGMTDMLAETEIAGILSGEGTPEAHVRALLEQALEKGGRDNITAVLCQVQEQEEKLSVTAWLKQQIQNGLF